MFHHQFTSIFLITVSIICSVSPVPVHMNITEDLSNNRISPITVSSTIKSTTSADWKEYPLLISNDIPLESVNASDNISLEGAESKSTRKSLFLERFLKHRNDYYYDNDLEDQRTKATESTPVPSTTSHTVTKSNRPKSTTNWLFGNDTNNLDLADDQYDENEAINGKKVDVKRILKWKKANALKRIKIAREEAAKQKFLESLDLRRSGGNNVDDEVPNPTTTTTEDPDKADPLAPVCPRIKYIHLPFYVWCLLSSFLFYKMRPACAI